MSDLWRSRPEPRSWFHVHTDRTHGSSSAVDYLEAAVDLAIDEVVFLEHVRRTPTYDPHAFRVDVLRQAEGLAMQVAVGFEAKILPGGSLDIPDDVLESADVIGVAEHAYPGTTESLVADFNRLLERLTARHAEQSFVWVHPGLWLRRTVDPFPVDTFATMLSVALASGFGIERNLKYDLVSATAFDSLPSEQRMIGLDAHSVAEARSRWLGLQAWASSDDPVPASAQRDGRD